jgi:hypothetical protein
MNFFYVAKYWGVAFETKVDILPAVNNKVPMNPRRSRYA